MRVKADAAPRSRPRRQAGRAHRAHVGRRPRRIQQSAAALVDVAVLDHDRLTGSRYLAAVSRPRQLPGPSRMDLGRRVEGRRRTRPKRASAALREIRRDGAARDRGGPAGAGDGRADLPHQLRAVPRLRRARRAGVSESARQRLALRRRSRDDRRQRHQRPHGRHAAARPGARRGRREERRRVRSLAVGPAERRAAGRSSASPCSSRPAPRATAWRARATRRSARRT